MFATREPLLQPDDPLLQPADVQTCIDDAVADGCGHDAIIGDAVDVPEPPRVVNVRLDRETCRRLRIMSAVRDAPMSHVIDDALVAYCKTDTVPVPYLPLDVQDAPKVRRTFYVRTGTYTMLVGRARLEVHSLDSVIYRAILDAVASIPEGLL